MPEKPWFQIELERVTREHWRVTTKSGSTSVACSHGMRIFVPFPQDWTSRFRTKQPNAGL